MLIATKEKKLLLIKSNNMKQWEQRHKTADIQ